MKKPFLLLLPLLTGVVSFFCRLVQNRTGFDTETGLSLGGVVTLLPMAVLLVSFLFYLVSALGIKTGKTDTFAASFAISDNTLPLFIGGVLLLLAGGGLTVMQSLSAGAMVEILLGLLGVVSGLSLFYLLALWRKKQSVPGNLLLPPVLLYTVWLMVGYKSFASYPVLERFYPQVLALAFLTWAFYHVAAFGFSQGSRKMLHISLPMTVTLNLMILADGLPLPALLLHIGGTVVLFGLWLGETAPNTSETAKAPETES